MAKDFNDLSLALSGLCLTAKLIDDLAIKGFCDDNLLRLSLATLLPKQHDSVLDLYGGNLAHFRPALQLTYHELRQTTERISRCWIAVLGVERELRNQETANRHIKVKIDYFQSQLAEKDLLEEENVAYLANIYTDHISPACRQIKITGDRRYLSERRIQNLIRALLLTGYRSAVLWRQLGGTKWDLLLRKGKLEAHLKALMNG